MGMTPKQKRLTFAVAALILAVVVFILVNTVFSLTNILRYNSTLIYSTRDVMNGLWENYKNDHLEANTYRTLDRDRGGITTSEGQSYTMLRAVWMDDKQTFDGAWRWTKDNLRRSGDDFLFSWLFGGRDDGTYGVLDMHGGYNTASDADTDIALSLALAYGRWQDPIYLAEARELIGDIWEKEVIEINGTPYLTANNLESSLRKSSVIINPSYFAPYAYKIFARIDEDPSHRWDDLAASSYDVIERSMAQSLDNRFSANLPPDWIVIDTTTGEIRAPENTDLTTNFGFEALRVPWRLALDWQWFQDERAKRVLEKMGFLSEEWRKDGELRAEYRHDGSVVSRFESPAMYAGALGYFIVVDPTASREIYTNKIIRNYNPTWYAWEDEPGYYGNNWRWFSVGLYNELLPNYTAHITDYPSSP
ncbi:MAG: glycosyl hydrolase family 8 [Candidatus Paceibacterota bacterium]